VDDEEIVELFTRRSESAVAELSGRYGKYLHAIAFNILGSMRDAEEIVNDTCVCVWNAIPPQQPQSLRAFAGKITRNLAINRLKLENRTKRGGGQAALALDELAECAADPHGTVDTGLEAGEITRAINAFLSEQPEKNRVIFVSRYWQVMSLQEISAAMQMPVGRVKSILFRMRKKLRKHLEREGIGL